MCGIAGIIGLTEEQPLRAMTEAIHHRGPDHTGFLVREGVGLGHARLSIIDPRAGAHQPMLSDDERYALVFNGEIYNFKSLRQGLEKSGYRFKTNSDTEVILALYAQDGALCFEKMHGMFAIALYDFKEKALVLARDRMGEKPLYWSHQGGMFVFASELKGLLASGLVRKEVNLHALDQYLQFDYVPTPHSMVRDVCKLEPATALIFKDGAISKKKFWAPPSELERIDEARAVDRLDSALHEVVERELVSDVPLGVFLSGGLDSSTVAYYAQAHHTQPIDTFSIGFDDPSFDESMFAREVAAHLHTNHHEEIVRAKDALDIVPTLGEVLCEPVADASIVPTMLLSRFARKSVTVALGGDGGDELFAGYPTFLAEPLHRAMPPLVRKAVRKVARALPASHKNFSFTYNLNKLVSSDESDTVRRHLEWLGTFDAAMRARLESERLRGAARNNDVFLDIETALKDFSQSDQNNRLLFAYARSYLMDQVLVKVDRASMRYALETRAPFLDHEIVDLVFSLPYELKYTHGTSKYLLKQAMRGKLPDHIIDRKKKGFGIPLAKWLAGPLRPLCEDLLSETALAEHGLFDVAEVRKLIKEHMSGKRDNRKELWNLMVFQLWCRRWMR
ncbi:MAG TPA: asparagine synthase (glutamine-hydrolyzing) [Candidatus Paceibacterota bacterium]